MLKDVSPKASGRGVRQARDLRRALSLPEVLLWHALRKRPGGLKFRRQHPTGPYIIDFFCGDARLAVEIDGTAHGLGDRPVRDQRRDAWLQAHGIATLRIAGTDVLRSVEMVTNAVVDVARARSPLHHASHGPPPRAEHGEDR